MLHTDQYKTFKREKDGNILTVTILCMYDDCYSVDTTVEWTGFSVLSTTEETNMVEKNGTIKLLNPFDESSASMDEVTVKRYASFYEKMEAIVNHKVALYLK